MAQAHVGAALLVAYLVNLLVPPAPPALGYLLAFALAAVLGTTVFVSYLRIADWWGSHTLEAFSGLRIADTSVLPIAPRRGTAATAVAIGEKAAHLLS